LAALPASNLPGHVLFTVQVEQTRSAARLTTGTYLELTPFCDGEPHRYIARANAYPYAFKIGIALVGVEAQDFIVSPTGRDQLSKEVRIRR
jgi:hypothetical protein